MGRPGGLARLALSEADREMRDLFVHWRRQAGCSVTIDRLGSIFGRRAGSEADLLPALIGSYLDTQVNGGKYDGILGVLAGLEVVRTLNDHGVATRRRIEIVSWTNEEGARVSPPMVGSGAFAAYSFHKVPFHVHKLDVDPPGSTIGPAPIAKSNPKSHLTQLHEETAVPTFSRGHVFLALRVTETEDFLLV